MSFPTISTNQAQNIALSLSAGVVAGFITKKATHALFGKIDRFFYEGKAEQHPKAVNLISNLFATIATFGAGLYVADRTRLLSIKELLATATAYFSSASSVKVDEVADQIQTPKEETPIVVEEVQTPTATPTVADETAVEEIKKPIQDTSISGLWTDGSDE